MPKCSRSRNFFDAADCSALSVRAARRATYAKFFVDGLGFGLSAGHIPAFKQKFQLSDSSLSIVLLLVALGSIFSMPLAGQVARHFGSKYCIAVSLGCYGLCLVSIALAPSLILFSVTALLFGAAKGGVDVGINAQAVTVEKCYGRPIMSSFQALWSVGGLVGLTDALLLPNPILAIAGFAVAGLGNSNLVPILFSAAGRDPIFGPGPGIAAVTTLGFCGFLIGPAMIGLMAKFFGLPIALSLVAVLGLITAICGPAAIHSYALTAKRNGGLQS
jgi:Major Facilitator Superfamily